MKETRETLVESIASSWAPSVGSVVKKVIAINPELSVQDVIQIVRSCVEKHGERAGEFAASEVVNESRALELARLTLRQRPGANLK